MRYVSPGLGCASKHSSAFANSRVEKCTGRKKEIESLWVPTTKNSPVTSQLKDFQSKRGSFSNPGGWLIDPSDRDEEVSLETSLSIYVTALIKRTLVLSIRLHNMLMNITFKVISVCVIFRL